LTCLDIDPDVSPIRAADLIAKLGAEEIEARHVWKPLHLQPSFAAAQAFVTGHAERLFNRGVAIPSGSSLSDDEVARVVDGLRGALA
jgi:dTDP-4-amino-4,6-dideoxygalactose transaminase